MADYTGLQSVLNASLGKYRAEGFRLVEDADHVLKLYYQDNLVGVMSQQGATIPLIHEVCRGHLDSLEGKDV